MRFIAILIAISLIGTQTVFSQIRNEAELREDMQAYMERVEQSRALRARIQFQVQRFYKGALTNNLKPELERIYSIPIEDPVYNTFPLFFNSVMAMQWDVILNGAQMTGVQTLNSSYTELRQDDPRIQTASPYLRKLENPDDLQREFRFSLNNSLDQHGSPMLDMIIPEALLDWMYLPALWYPSLQQLGAPDDISRIERRTSTIQPSMLVFTPQSLDPRFIAYLKSLAMNDELTVDDLTVMLTYDPKHYACLKLNIGVKQQPDSLWANDNLIMVSHTIGSATPEGLPLPNNSSLWINAIIQDGNEKATKSVYYSNMTATGIEFF